MINTTFRWYILIDDNDKEYVKTSTQKLEMFANNVDECVVKMREILGNKEDLFCYSYFMEKESKKPSFFSSFLGESEDTDLDIRLTVGEGRKQYHLSFADYKLGVTKEQLVNDLFPNVEELDKKDYDKKADEFLTLQKEAKNSRDWIGYIRYLKDLQKNAVSFGLDLAGGINIVVDVDPDKLRRQVEQKYKRDIEYRLEKNKDDKTNKTWVEEQTEKIKAKNPSISEDELKKEIDKSMKVEVEKQFTEKEEEVAEIYATDAVEIPKQVYTRLRERVDQFGVSEPQIDLGMGSRILISLPGATDKERVINTVTKAGNLNFHLVDEETMNKVPDDLFNYGEEQNLIQKLPMPVIKDKLEKAGIEVALEDSGISMELYRKDQREKLKDFLKQYNYSYDKTFDVNEGIKIANILEKSAFEMEEVEKNLSAYNEGKPASKRLEATVKFREGILSLGKDKRSRLYPVVETSKVGYKHILGYLIVLKKIELAGDHLESASVAYETGVSGSASKPYIGFSMDREGGNIFYDVTKNHTNERLAIVLDDEVKSFPNIQEPIPGGQGRITGNFTLEEVQDIVGILKAGKMKATLRLVNEKTIEETLGAENVKFGGTSAFIGLILVLLFMLIYYRYSGFLANIALIINLFILMAVLSAMNFTLTLPGIAGMVLTLAMAVDANVIIFERIKEEARLGKTPLDAIEQGFGRAFWTIFDANLTTVLAALVLSQFGSSIIKGFGVTLMWGIIVSMITALFITRVMIDISMRMFKFKKLSI